MNEPTKAEYEQAGVDLRAQEQAYLEYLSRKQGEGELPAEEQAYLGVPVLEAGRRGEKERYGRLPQAKRRISPRSSPPASVRRHNGCVSGLID